jgi:hypothetical protein
MMKTDKFISPKKNKNPLSYALSDLKSRTRRLAKKVAPIAAPINSK